MSNSTHSPALPEPPSPGATKSRIGISRSLAFRAVGFGILFASLGGLITGFVAGVIPNPFASSAQAHPIDANSSSVAKVQAPLVKVVRPILESSVPITTESLATVEPYYRTDLRARASGNVKAVHGDIGDKVSAGEVLVEIDVPESEQEVAQKKAMVTQREQELSVSEAKLSDAKAARDVSAATIKQREAEVQAMIATRDLKKRVFERYKTLARNGTVVGSLEEEQEKDYLASEAAVTAANANLDRARADYAESDSKIKGAAADIKLKQAQIEVALRDVDRAMAVADYGKVLAPFDGVIVRRQVDPGSFVQNATTGASETLVSVSRVDLVTVVAKFTDDAAPYISKDSPCTIQIDDLPGVTIDCKVTRFSPSIQDADRTVRVEVDLFNGDAADYERVQEMYRSGEKNHLLKGVNDPIPERAFRETSSKGLQLLPGMTGIMKVSIGGFGKSYLLPSSCIYARSGATYILIVDNDKAKQLPVRVQLNDGKMARVSIVTTRQTNNGATREVLSDLTGTENVVVARQLEIADGETVTPSLVE